MAEQLFFTSEAISLAGKLNKADVDVNDANMTVPAVDTGGVNNPDITITPSGGNT